MSQKNVEIVRRAIDLFNAGTSDEALQEVASDFELDWSNSIGPAVVDAWETVRWDPEEIIDVDDSRVITVNRVHLRGRCSGVELDATGVQLWSINDGEPERVKLYQTKADALEAAGLRE